MGKISDASRIIRPNQAWKKRNNPKPNRIGRNSPTKLTKTAGEKNGKLVVPFVRGKSVSSGGNRFLVLRNRSVHRDKPPVLVPEVPIPAAVVLRRPTINTAGTKDDPDPPEEVRVPEKKATKELKVVIPKVKIDGDSVKKASKTEVSERSRAKQAPKK